MEAATEDDPFKPPTRREALVPAMAVAAVAVVAVTAAVMVKRGDETTPAAAVAQRSAAPVENVDVVKAPPLERPVTSVMGGAPACKECGVVQMVVAVLEEGARKPNGYQMHIRMDDGSVRTVQQRGALAAGSRVMVEGETVRVLAEPRRSG